MTDEQIIKALECCYIHSACTGCPCAGSDVDCLVGVGEGAIDLINNQKADIERLREDNSSLNETVSNLLNQFKNIKSEAIKEFVERLKAGSIWVDLVSFTRIDNILKEMVGKNEN